MGRKSFFRGPKISLNAGLQGIKYAFKKLPNKTTKVTGPDSFDPDEKRNTINTTLRDYLKDRLGHDPSDTEMEESRKVLNTENLILNPEVNAGAALDKLRERIAAYSSPNASLPLTGGERETEELLRRRLAYGLDQNLSLEQFRNLIPFSGARGEEAVGFEIQKAQENKIKDLVGKLPQEAAANRQAISDELLKYQTELFNRLQPQIESSLNARGLLQSGSPLISALSQSAADLAREREASLAPYIREDYQRSSQAGYENQLRLALGAGTRLGGLEEYGKQLNFLRNQQEFSAQQNALQRNFQEQALNYQRQQDRANRRLGYAQALGSFGGTLAGAGIYGMFASPSYENELLKYLKRNNSGVG